jgi:hypothetical protein
VLSSSDDLGSKGSLVDSRGLTQHEAADRLPADVPPSILLTDRFSDARRAGRVVGTRIAGGATRLGVDREGVISSDNGALRIAPLVEPGWDRAGLAYGPFPRETGVALSVFMLNGHNTAQSENLRETFRARLGQWLEGSGTYRLRVRLVSWLLSGRIARTLRQARWWRRISKDAPAVPPVNENLAVGWFADEVPADPLTQGNAFVMHATGPENGELWTRVGSGCLPAVRGVQNLQMYYVVVLRERGAAYYAASVADANGLTAYPDLRPVGIDPFNSTPELYAGVHQSTLGQIGFRLDTRVYGIRVARLPEFSTWYGSAHAADTLEGLGSLIDAPAEVGGWWHQVRGDFTRRADGASPGGFESLALLDPGAESALVHAVVQVPAGAAGAIGLVWRARDPDHFWCVRIGIEHSELMIVENGVRTTVARGAGLTAPANTLHAVQVLDDGRRFSLHIDGGLLFGRYFEDDRLASGTGAGIWADAADQFRMTRFEAHPRRVPLPDALNLGEPWRRVGAELVVADDFVGSPGELDGRRTGVGGKVWTKQLGTGVFRAGDGALKIDASVERPNPGRTMYMVDWDHPDFADLEVEITPPGTARGQREHGLCGFVLWQDPQNYVTINIWVHDSYGGASISTFFQIDGFEDLYDAIWSNVGESVHWGRPNRLRISFDGMHYTTFLDDRPVLYRALTDVYQHCPRLAINRVGLIANWEWGNDTGSTFRHFRARR